MVKQLSPRELSEAMSRGERVYLLDVRKPWEHERASLPGSVLIPLDELEERFDEINPPEGALIVAYCHHGVRSLSAAAICEGMGLSGVVSLRGGIDAWSRDIEPGVPRY